MGVFLKRKDKTFSLRDLHFYLLYLLLAGVFFYYFVCMSPKNSVELYETISFSEDYEAVQSLVLKGYEANFKEEDFISLQKLGPTMNRVSQVTLLEYENRTFLVMTSPGTEQLKVLAVEELPEEIRSYFLGLNPSSR
ncbi:hypothetical protein [Alkalihalobacillus sp. CinArs1]|uniref:hypothetical protein n=1 Tax=Alkalihalobacillus sp. CinArs1 TaxID=2995314 RepID=UPI0022DCE6FA|nr:hypothetical protein [Alkalihalobacillus sp. CinArs1]